jgi:hypothetical protein
MPTDEKDAEKPRAGTDGPLAIALLVEDHRVLERLFENYEKTPQNKRQEIVEEACLRLIVHTRIEEEIFYPAIRGKITDDEVDEALVEHQAAERLIEELEEMTPGDELYDAKFKVLGEQVLHHVKEEEEGMFIEVQETDLDLDSLGRKLEERKQALVEELKQTGTVEAE